MSTTGPACPSGFCADLVCCDSACDGPMQACNIPQHIGTCTAIINGAPTTSSTGLIVAVLVLTAVAAFALRYRVRGR